VKTPRRKSPGYYLEILHETPKGEVHRTLMVWEEAKRSRKMLHRFLMAYESHFAFKRPDVGKSLGYTPKPFALNLRNGITRHIVCSWKRAA
jgi:hypothetical protein